MTISKDLGGSARSRALSNRVVFEFSAGCETCPDQSPSTALRAGFSRAMAPAPHRLDERVSSVLSPLFCSHFSQDRGEMGHAALSHFQTRQLVVASARSPSTISFASASPQP